jgi:hypothetical protein
MRPPGPDGFRGREARRQLGAKRERDDRRNVDFCQGISHDIESVRLTFEGVENPRNILCAPDFVRRRFKP